MKENIRTISRYEYNGENFAMITDWSLLIEKMLENIEFEHNHDYRIHTELDKKYYALNNPFGDGDRMSCIIHASSGNMRIYNSGLPTVIRAGVKVKDSSITLTELARLFSLLNKKTDSFADYIDFILNHYNISHVIYNQYKEILLNEKLTEMNSYDKMHKPRGYHNFRMFLFKHYIVDDDVLKSKNRTSVEIETKFKFELKEVENKPKPEITEATGFSKMVIDRYLKSRKLETCENILPVIVSWKAGAYKNYGVQLKYSDSFSKIRLIDNPKLRYFADGKYESLFEAKNIGSDEAFLIEGEFEAMTASKYLDCDVFALHNVNSLPNSISFLERYRKISIRIDYDNEQKFNDSKIAISSKLNNSNIFNYEILPKFVFPDGRIDYNLVDVKNGLDKKWIIEPLKSEDYYEVIKKLTK